MKRTREQSIYRVTLLGTLGNIMLCAFKFAAGAVGRSSAMVADAVHSLSDLLTDVIVLVMVRFSSRPRDDEHNYGHGKFETLATAIIGILLFAVGAGLFYYGTRDVWDFCHGKPLNPPGIIALIAALVSIIVKEGLYHYTMRAGVALKSPAMQANAWHHRSDALSSIGTTSGIAGAILLGPGWAVLDPIAAVAVSLLIMRVAWQLFKPCIDELLEHSLDPETEKKILDILSSEPHVSDVHNLRTRKIGPVSSVEAHVRMPDDMSVKQSHDITRRMEDGLRNLLGEDTYVNIHIEPRSASHRSKAEMQARHRDT